MTQPEKLRSLYQSYLECCNAHDVDGMASFYTSTMKINDVPMDAATVAAQFPPLFSAFPDWHWEIENLVVDGEYISLRFTVTGTHRGLFEESTRPVVGSLLRSSRCIASKAPSSPRSGTSPIWTR